MVAVRVPSMRSIDDVLEALKSERNTFAADRVMDAAADVIREQRAALAEKDKRIAELEVLAKAGPEDRKLVSGAFVARIAELEAGLGDLMMFYRLSGEDSLEHFERVAEQFYRDTGYLRPGKDCRLHGDEVRRAKWDEWVDGKIARARALLSAAEKGSG